jgi:hypothetical protein
MLTASGGSGDRAGVCNSSTTRSGSGGRIAVLCNSHDYATDAISDWLLATRVWGSNTVAGTASAGGTEFINCGDTSNVLRLDAGYANVSAPQPVIFLSPSEQAVSLRQVVMLNATSPQFRINGGSPALPLPLLRVTSITADGAIYSKLFPYITGLNAGTQMPISLSGGIGKDSPATPIVYSLPASVYVGPDALTATVQTLSVQARGNNTATLEDIWLSTANANISSIDTLRFTAASPVRINATVSDINRIVAASGSSVVLNIVRCPLYGSDGSGTFPLLSISVLNASLTIRGCSLSLSNISVTLGGKLTFGNVASVSLSDTIMTDVTSTISFETPARLTARTFANSSAASGNVTSGPYTSTNVTIQGFQPRLGLAGGVVNIDLRFWAGYSGYAYTSAIVEAGLCEALSNATCDFTRRYPFVSFTSYITANGERSTVSLNSCLHFSLSVGSEVVVAGLTADDPGLSVAVLLPYTILADGTRLASGQSFSYLRPLTLLVNLTTNAGNSSITVAGTPWCIPSSHSFVHPISPLLTLSVNETTGRSISNISVVCTLDVALVSGEALSSDIAVMVRCSLSNLRTDYNYISEIAAGRVFGSRLGCARQSFSSNGLISTGWHPSAFRRGGFITSHLLCGLSSQNIYWLLALVLQHCLLQGFTRVVVSPSITVVVLNATLDWIVPPPAAVLPVRVTAVISNFNPMEFIAGDCYQRFHCSASLARH